MANVRGDGGRCHLVRDGEREAGLSIYAGRMKAGAPGLFITRLGPLDAAGGEPRQTTIRLSSLPGNGNFRPDQLGLLQKAVFDFMDKNPAPAVFLEGLDYILVDKEFEDLVRFMYALGDKAMGSGATVIVSTHGAGFDAGKITIMERALASVPI